MRVKTENTIYDCIIIGAGSVGYGTAMYNGRFGMKTLVLGDMPGGTIILTHVVENYPGFIRLTGQELADKLREHALDYKNWVEMKEDKAIDVKKKDKLFVVKTESGEFLTKTLIFATGTRVRKLGIPGEDEFTNRGVSYCALCDGALFRGKTIVVVGGSDSAAKEALLLTEYAKKVYITCRGEKIRPEPINMERIGEKIKEGKIEIINGVNILGIKGDKSVKKIVLDKPYKGKKEFPTDGVFIEIGHIPLSELAAKLGAKTNDKGEIIIDRESKTNVPGVFAAGDVVDTRFKQAITGIGEGVSASYSAYQYLKENEKILPTTGEGYEKFNEKVPEKEMKRIVAKIKK